MNVGRAIFRAVADFSQVRRESSSTARDLDRDARNIDNSYTSSSGFGTGFSRVFQRMSRDSGAAADSSEGDADRTGTAWSRVSEHLQDVQQNVRATADETRAASTQMSSQVGRLRQQIAASAAAQRQASQQQIASAQEAGDAEEELGNRRLRGSALWQAVIAEQERAVTAAHENLLDSNQAQVASTESVRVAEGRLAETRRQSEVSTAQATRAQEQLTAAREKMVATQDRVTAATKKLDDAQTEQTNGLTALRAKVSEYSDAVVVSSARVANARGMETDAIEELKQSQIEFDAVRRRSDSDSVASETAAARLAAAYKNLTSAQRETGRANAEAETSQNRLTTGTDRLQTATTRYEEAVSRAADNVERAKQREATAQEVVIKAQERLSDVREQGANSSARIVAAEESVAEAHAGVTRAQEDTTRSSERFQVAQSELATAMERDGNRMSVRWRNAMQSIRREASEGATSLSEMSANIQSSGARGARAFAQAFTLVVAGLSVIAPAAGAVGASLISAVGSVITFAGSLGQLAGVAALVPAGIIAVAAAGGVLKAAFSGIGGALKAASEASTANAGTTKKSAAALEDAARGVARAEEAAAEGRESAARRVATAVANAAETQAASARRVADAETNAAQVREDADRKVEDAKSGLARAVSEAGQRQQDAARKIADAEAAAADQRAKSDRAIANTRKALVTAIADAATKQADAARRVREAEEQAGVARERSDRNIASARNTLVAAVAEAASRQTTAIKRVADAERDVERANRRVTDSQRELNDARAEAKRRVDDLSTSLESANLSERQASFAYQDALSAYNEALNSSEYDGGDVARRKLDLDQASFSLKEARKRTVELSAAQKQAADEGVSGNRQVIAADQAVQDAIQAQTDAKQAAADAGRGVAEAEVAGAERIAEARRGLADAEAEAARSRIESQQRITDAEANATTAAQEGAEKIAAAQQAIVDAQAEAASAQEAAQRRIADAVDDAAQTQIDSAARISEAQRNVTDAARDAARDRAAAEQSVTDAVEDAARAQMDATQAVADARRDQEKADRDGTRGVEDAVRALQRAQEDQGEAAVAGGNKAAEALAKLTPNGRAAVGTLLSVLDRLNAVRDVAQENFFEGFGAPLVALADTVIPQLLTGVGAIATQMGAGAQILMGALSGALGGGVLEGMLLAVATSIGIANGAITPLVEAFVTLGSVGLEYLPRLAQWIVDLSTRFNEFIQKAEADGSLRKWIDDGIQAWKDLWSVGESIIGIFDAIGEAAKVGGASASLGGLAQGLRDVEAMMQSEVFQTTLAKIFEGAAAGAEGLRAALGPIGEAFRTGAPAFAEFLRLGGEIAGTFIGGIFTALSSPGFGAGLTTFLEAVQRGVEAIAPLLPGLTDAFGTFLGALGPIVEKLGPTLVVVLTNFAEGLGKVLEFLSPLLTSMADSPGLVGGLIAAFIAVAGAVSGLMIIGTIAGLAKKAWDGFQLIKKGIGLLRIAMAAHPIGLIITAIGLLIAGLIWFFTETEVGRKLWANFTEDLKRLGQGISDWWTNEFMPALGAGWEYLKGEWGEAVKFFEGIWTGLQDGAQSVIDWFLNDFMPQFSRIWTDLPGLMADIGKNIIIGLVDGLGGDGQKVYDWLIEMTTKAIQFVKDLFGIASPSTVFADIGRWLIEGLVNGLVNAGQLVLDALTKVGGWFAGLYDTYVKPAFDKVREIVTDVLGYVGAFITSKVLEIQTVWGTGWQIVRDALGAAWDWISKKVSDAFEAVVSFLAQRLENLKTNWSNIWTAVSTKLGEIWDAISTKVTQVWDFVSSWLNTKLEQFKLGWAIIWAAVRQKLADEWESISSKVQAVWDFIATWLAQKIESFKTSWSAAWTWISTKAAELWDSIQKKITETWTAIVTWLATKIESFKTSWNTAWTWVRDKASELWDSFQKKVQDTWESVTTWLSTKIETFKTNWSSAWTFVRDKASELWNGLKDRLTETYDKYIKPLFDVLGNFVRVTLPGRFQAGIDAIGTIWDTLKGLARTPIAFVVDLINRGLVGNFNKIADKLNVGRLPEVTMPFGLATGGPVPGYSSTPTQDNIPIMATAGEFMVRHFAAQNLARKHPGSLEYINKYGELPGVDNGYATGGFIWPVGGQYPIGQRPSNGHRAYDISTPVGTRVGAAAAGRVSHAGPGFRAPGVWGGTEVHVDHGGGVGSLYAHLSAMMVKVGQMVSQNQHIANTGNTGISSGPHLHFGALRGQYDMASPDPYLNGQIPKGGFTGTGGGFGGEAEESRTGSGIFSAFGTIISNLMTEIRDKVPGAGLFRDMAVEGGKKAVGLALDWAKGKFDAVVDVAKDVWENIKGFLPGLGNMAIAPKGTLYDTGGKVRPGRTVVDNESGEPEALLTNTQWAQMLALVAVTSQLTRNIAQQQSSMLVPTPLDFGALLGTPDTSVFQPAASGGPAPKAEVNERGGDRYQIDLLRIENATPEPASDSLAKAVRKMTTIGVGKK